MNQYYTIILFFPDEAERTPAKYRNINNIANFRRFADTTGAKYMNVYNKQTKAFIEQIKLN